VVTGNEADAAEVTEACAVWWSIKRDPVVGEGSTCKVCEKALDNLNRQVLNESKKYINEDT